MAFILNSVTQSMHSVWHTCTSVFTWSTEWLVNRWKQNTSEFPRVDSISDLLDQVWANKKEPEAIELLDFHISDKPFDSNEEDIKLGTKIKEH